jgi:hypothetical protein
MDLHPRLAFVSPDLPVEAGHQVSGDSLSWVRRYHEYGGPRLELDQCLKSQVPQTRPLRGVRHGVEVPEVLMNRTAPLSEHSIQCFGSMASGQSRPSRLVRTAAARARRSRARAHRRMEEHPGPATRAKRSSACRHCQQSDTPHEHRENTRMEVCHWWESYCATGSARDLPVRHAAESATATRSPSAQPSSDCTPSVPHTSGVRAHPDELPHV